jgi:hypothetical protein
MSNPGIKEEIWLALNQKWDRLVADGHPVKVEFKVIKDAGDKSRVLAIDVAQNIDNQWYVQTIQRKVREAYPVIGIEGVTLDQLINLAGRVIGSIIEPITGSGTYDDEMHLFMKYISPETAEIHGHVVSKKGEKVGIRVNYRQYYVLNEILEQISAIMKEKYAEIQVHRDKDDNGKIYFRFVHPAKSKL